MEQSKKVTGIGGIFFKCKDPQQTREWYHKNLGIDANQYGFSFEWQDKDNPERKGTTQWCPFPDSTQYFEPSDKPFMINYRVHDLAALALELEKGAVTILGPIANYDYGKFLHVLDNDGNKIELWEPTE